MQIYKPFVRIAAGSTAPLRDGLAAEDDWLCRRLTTCTFCGRPAVPGDWNCVVFLTTRVVPALHCRDCRRRDPTMASLHAMLVARYGD
jgi:hypothetical protein